jgi:hypothetical protein
MKNRTFPSSASGRHRPRRRGTSRLFVISAAVVASTALSDKANVYAQGQGRNEQAGTHASNVGASSTGEQVGAVQSFDIPGGTIGNVAQRFSAATGIRIALANESMRDLSSPGVNGLMTREEALEQILAGTGVGFAFTSRDSVTLDIRRSERVEVTGSARTLASPKFTQALTDIPQTIAVIPRRSFNPRAPPVFVTSSVTSRALPFNQGRVVAVCARCVQPRAG